MKKPTIIILSALLLNQLTASSSLALDMEYYTYGGFNPITQAFTKIALIFSDTGYQGLLFVIMVLGLLAGVTAWLARAATGARVIPLVWAVPVVFGAVLYLALFVPKGNITVYDPVLNRFQTIGQVPNAVVFTAGFLNKIERGMIDIMDTAAAPDAQYQTTAGGIGFKSLESVKGSTPKNNYARTSMIRYVKDCVTFELLRPGTTLSLDDLRNTTSDFLGNLSAAVNPAVYTLYYDSAHPEGTNVTCTDAWNSLQPIYANPNNYDEAIKKVCSKAYFDPSNAVELNTCKTLLTSTLNFTTGTATTPEKIIQQRQIAEILYTFYFQDDYETAMLMESSRKITSTGLGIGLTMNEWIPIIRAVMTAIAIGVIPFLVLFLFTPVVGKAISVMFGFFVFLTTWGITDAVIHGAAMDYASYAFEDMRQSNLGVYAMAAFPTISLKLLAMFGVIRSAGIMLASFFSMMLIRFGGHALAMLAGNLSRIVQSAGAQAGQLLTPEGTSAAMNQQVRAAGLLAGMPEHRFSNMAAAQAWTTHRSVGGYSAAINAKNALQESGQIPPGTSDSDMATMMASARVSAGTSSGPVEISTAPDGNATRTKSETVNQDGSTTITTTGAGGNGVAVDTMAEGRAAYSVDSSGKHQTTHAAVNGLNPVTVGAMAQQQQIVAASNSLGRSQNWQQAMDTAKRASLTSSEAQSFTSRLDNAMRESWKRAINDKSSFIQSMDQTSRTQFQATIGSGFKKIFSGNGQIAVVGNNNEAVTFNVSEDTARAFENTASRVRSESLQQTLQKSKSLDYMTKLAKQIGATEAYSYLNDAREMRGSTESYGADLTTALVRNYATERYGDESPENIRRTISDFNHFLTQQGSHGVDNMKDIVTGFVSGNGYGWGSTADTVNTTIANTREHVQNQNFKQNVGMTSSLAGSKTFGIQDDTLATPQSAIPMDSPKTAPVTDQAQGIRNRNRIEESGKGGIHTTARDLAQDITGLNKGAPPRPTHDFYRNQSFYYEGSLVEPQQQNGGIVLPSGKVIDGGAGYTAPQNTKDFLKGSVFEKK
ncbi:conjugal transfer protein TraG N-terminal domain-containing protein [Desulfogranum marinum]|uniref:conjugal transfer protein TraG N-terminal domain-containing protein n=1 Tax=Desulfogranum marinum TaxID=453220 RepID=UPI0029C75741|nr:conjugal transfer protein TraG N-terminal domain-containing protein [Desulfogranum marinum]